MKRFILILSLSLPLISVGTMAYEICSDPDGGFELDCNDGYSTSWPSPPNEISANAVCSDHGGVAAGYPRPIIKISKQPTEGCQNTGFLNIDLGAVTLNSTSRNR